MNQTTTPSNLAASEPRRPLSAAKVLLFSTVLVLLLGGIAEGAAQWYLRSARGYSGGEFLQYQFDPYKNILLTQGWRDTRGVTHNRQGFRHQGEVVVPKPRDTFRIFLMGASTAYGLGGMWPHLQTTYAVLDDSTTIDRYLERLLADRFPGLRVEVINAGIPSIWTHHHLIYLNQAILGYDPDLVLFLDGWNDHFFINPGHDQFGSYAQTEQASGIMGPPTLNSLIRMNAWWLFRKSAAAQVVGRALRDIGPVLSGRKAKSPIQVDSALVTATANFDRGPRKMIERNALILQHEGIPAIFMLQPMLALERTRMQRMPEIERRLFEFNLSAEHPNYEAFLQRMVPIVAERLRQTLEPLGGSFLDLTAIYPTSDGQIFTDYAHLTPEGNRRLAEALIDEVVRRGTPRAEARRRAEQSKVSP